METYNIHLVATDKVGKESVGLLVLANWVTGENHLAINNNPDIDKVYKAQHLYITSSEEIKEGDWYLIKGIVKNIISKATSDNTNMRNTVMKGLCLKIVATDNKELWWGDRIYKGVAVSEYLAIAKIPQSLIELYVREWNAGKPMKKVKLKKEGIYLFDTTKPPLNTNQSDISNVVSTTSEGYVIPLPIKEKMYSREEIMLILANWEPNTKLSIKEWFNKNYP